MQSEKGTDTAQPARDGLSAAPGGDGDGWTAGRVAIRCGPSWAAWLGRLAGHCDTTAATVIAEALRRYGDQTGYPEPPPARLPGRAEGRVGTRARRALSGIGRGQEHE